MEKSNATFYQFVMMSFRRKNIQELPSYWIKNIMLKKNKPKTEKVIQVTMKNGYKIGNSLINKELQKTGLPIITNYVK